MRCCGGWVGGAGQEWCVLLGTPKEGGSGHHHQGEDGVGQVFEQVLLTGGEDSSQIVAMRVYLGPRMEEEETMGMLKE